MEKQFDCVFTREYVCAQDSFHSLVCLFVVIDQQMRVCCTLSVTVGEPGRLVRALRELLSRFSSDPNLLVLEKCHICQNSSFEQRTTLNGFVLSTMFEFTVCGC